MAKLKKKNLQNLKAQIVTKQKKYFDNLKTQIFAVVIVSLVTVAEVTVVIVIYFSNNNLTPQNP